MLPPLWKEYFWFWFRSYFVRYNWEFRHFSGVTQIRLGPEITKFDENVKTEKKFFWLRIPVVVCPRSTDLKQNFLELKTQQFRGKDPILHIFQVEGGKRGTSSVSHSCNQRFLHLEFAHLGQVLAAHEKLHGGKDGESSKCRVQLNEDSRRRKTKTKYEHIDIHLKI